jgi:hypothetical protein
VCVPRATAEDPAAVRREVVSVLGALRGAGVAVERPAVVNDSVVLGRFSRVSTRHIWWLRLTGVRDDGRLRYAVTRRVVGFPCRDPDDEAVQRAVLWASAVAGAEDAALRRQREEVFTGDEGRRLARSRAEVERVLALSVAGQSAWYRETVRGACGDARAVGGH